MPVYVYSESFAYFYFVSFRYFFCFVIAIAMCLTTTSLLTLLCSSCDLLGISPVLHRLRPLADTDNFSFPGAVRVIMRKPRNLTVSVTVPRRVAAVFVISFRGGVLCPLSPVLRWIQCT